MYVFEHFNPVSPVNRNVYLTTCIKAVFVKPLKLNNFIYFVCTEE